MPVSGKTLKKTTLVVALIIACSGASVECYIPAYFSYAKRIDRDREITSSGETVTAERRLLHCGINGDRKDCRLFENSPVRS